MDPDSDVETPSNPRDQRLTDIPITPQIMKERSCDLQGIEWKDFHPTTRASFRTQRITNYRNYRNTSTPHSHIAQSLFYPHTDLSFYSFRYTLIKHQFKCSEYHFQLRNLLWATTPHSVLYSHAETIRSWNSIPQTSHLVLKTDRFRMSTFSAWEDVVFVGAFSGEYAFCRMNDEAAAGNFSLENGIAQEQVRSGVITNNQFGITNHIELGLNRNGDAIALISSNDDSVRLLDLKTQVLTHHFVFPWAANCSSLSPDKRLICVTGDDTDPSIISADSGDEIVRLKGHIDFAFSCAWSPCGRFICTGNQDLTTRVFDIRNPTSALVVLPAIMGAVRSLRFSDNGAFLAASEPCDFLHIYDFHGTKFQTSASSPSHAQITQSPLGDTAFQSQVLDFFGEIAGFSFTPDGADTLYVGCSDQRYGSILEFGRTKQGGDLFLEQVVL